MEIGVGIDFFGIFFGCECVCFLLGNFIIGLLILYYNIWLGGVGL